MSLFLADLFISERLSAFNAIIAFALFQSLKSFYETSVAWVSFSGSYIGIGISMRILLAASLDLLVT